MQDRICIKTTSCFFATFPVENGRVNFGPHSSIRFSMRFISFFLILGFAVSCTTNDNTTHQLGLSEEAALAYMAGMNEADTVRFGKVLHPEFKRLTGGVADLEGRNAMLEMVSGFRINMPDFKMEPIAIAPGVSNAGIFWMAHSKYGEKDISWTGATMLSLDENGLITEERIVGDRLGMFQQMGYMLQRPDELTGEEETVHPGVKDVE